MSLRDWCFTCYDTEKELVFDKDKIRYIIYGRESCPTTGREHYQGFGIANRTCRVPKFQLWTGIGKSHCEPRGGARDTARDYCRGGGWFGSGSKRKWKDLNEEVFEWGKFDGFTKEDLFKQPIGYLKREYPEFYCRYHNGLEKLQDKGPKFREVEIHIRWGPPRTGKTRYVMEMDDVYKWDHPYRWFDGYEGESILLIDDYKKDDINRGMLLHILEGYRQMLPIKGSHTFAKWTKVYITTNFDPEGNWMTEAIKGRMMDNKNSSVTHVTA